MKIREIFTKTINYTLLNINLNIIDQKAEFLIDDRFDDIHIEKDKLSLIYVREIVFPAENSYKLEIKVRVRRTAKEDVDLKEILNEKTILENADNILNLVSNYVSLLISEMTGSFGNVPLVTPPTFLKQKNKT